MKTVAYLRVSTRSQDLANQKLAILDHANQWEIKEESVVLNAFRHHRPFHPPTPAYRRCYK